MLELRVSLQISVTNQKTTIGIVNIKFFHTRDLR